MRLERARAAGLGWPRPENCDDEWLAELLFPTRGQPERPTGRAAVDFAAVQRQMHTHKRVTLQLVWEEYREAHPAGYSYSHYVAVPFMLRNHLNAMNDARSCDVRAT